MQAFPGGSPIRDPAVEWCRLGNVPLSRVSLWQTVDLIAVWARDEPFRLVVTPNVDHIVKLQDNSAFREAYSQAALSLPDGMPVLWAARYLGLPPLEKVSGSDLVPALCSRAATDGLRVFVAGGQSQEDLESGLDVIRRRYPGLTASGRCPRLGFEDDPKQSAQLADAILDFRTDLLLFACGAPKSDIWMHRYRERLGRGVGIGIGAGFDFLAGRARRAPVWMQRVGMEWLWRLGREPRRLARRYLWDDLGFFPLVWRWRRESPR
jgi:N-acetylglucosaminyldiphosphoundecaprenol N-acetyl-beta-D-mannosaminyltransferase